MPRATSYRHNLNQPLPDSPVEVALKAGPRADASWPAFSEVYRLIAQGAQQMARTQYVHLSEDHIQTMADLGSSHEERMKTRLHWLRLYKYL